MRTYPLCGIGWERQKVPFSAGSFLRRNRRAPQPCSPKRRAVDVFIRSGGLFDGVADFDQATLDPATGQLRAEFVPDSTTGGVGDKLHPNRAGYLAMAGIIDLKLLFSAELGR